MNALSFDRVVALTADRLGTIDIACPLCGPEKRTAANRARKVLRIWRLTESFAGFCCQRCGEKGHVLDRGRGGTPPDPVKLARARTEAAERERRATMERLSKARWLWSTRLPIVGTAAETYLRGPRGYGGSLQATLGFLPGRAGFPPAMIAAFGLPAEPEPGRLAINDCAVAGVHITRLAADGSGKAGTGHDKIMIGRSLGSPIVLAPVNDMFGLAIAEGIEDALSVYEATGLGAWAAGSASRLPALTAAIPPYVECISIMVDDDRDGRRHAGKLAELVTARGIEARQIFLSRTRRIAA